MQQDWAKDVWDAAQQLGLTSRWEWWALVAVALVALVLVKRLGPGAWSWVKAAALRWHSLPAKPDLIDKPPSDPIPTQGGTPTLSGSIPVPGPGDRPWERP